MARYVDGRNRSHDLSPVVLATRPERENAHLALELAAHAKNIIATVNAQAVQPERQRAVRDLGYGIDAIIDIINGIP
jgi:hypothetical protein